MAAAAAAIAGGSNMGSSLVSGAFSYAANQNTNSTNKDITRMNNWQLSVRQFRAYQNSSKLLNQTGAITRRNLTTLGEQTRKNIEASGVQARKNLVQGGLTYESNRAVDFSNFKKRTNFMLDTGKKEGISPGVMLLGGGSVGSKSSGPQRHEYSKGSYRTTSMFDNTTYQGTTSQQQVGNLGTLPSGVIS